ncbi:hypothetical protein [Actinoallomurus soli]|uniref:hypothetical protein n=1 Tax=Actinoallomurus soli TaxID=2952535 RepID=UPI00209222BA|nr:hypothetical protein [Actinoallomurus soli]MCO5972563.1 hypothetical protein [Actinoallomurus soli]
MRPRPSGDPHATGQDLGLVDTLPSPAGGASWIRRCLAAPVRHPWTVTLLLGALVIALNLRGPDLPAQYFRTWVARTAGLVAFNNQWYDGHSLPGYSVLFPPIAAVLGARITGLISCTVITWAACRLLPGPRDSAQIFFRLALAIGIVGELIIGQLPFALGLAFGLAALLAAIEGLPLLVLMMAACSSLSSPLAGLFLLLAGLSWAPQAGWRRVAPLGSAALGMLVSFVTGGGSGRFPFPLVNLLGVLLFSALTLAVTPRSSTLIRRFAVIYGGLSAALFVVPNPVGANIARLGSTLALPAAGYLLLRYGQRLVLALLIVPLLSWQLVPVATALANSAGDPSSNASYYTGLQSFLATRRPAAGRLEVPFTREHWETVFLAQRFPMARGWERQLDLRYSPALYRPLTAEGYRAWLNANAVGLVALPDVPLDRGGLSEAALLADPPSYLHEVWHDAHWKVWEVADAVPLASGPATLRTLEVSSFILDFPTAGTETVRIHANDMWGVADGGAACLTTTPDGWFQVTALRPGPVRVHATVRNIIDRDTHPECAFAESPHPATSGG